MRGVSFDLFHNVGCIFTLLPQIDFKAFQGFSSLEKSPEACARRCTKGFFGLVAGRCPQPWPPSQKAPKVWWELEAQGLQRLLDAFRMLFECFLNLK